MGAVKQYVNNLNDLFFFLFPSTKIKYLKLMILCAIYFRCNNKVVSDNLSWNWECLLMRISIDWLSNLIFWLIWWNYLNRTFYHCLSIKQCFSKSHFYLESIFFLSILFQINVHRLTWFIAWLICILTEPKADMSTRRRRRKEKIFQ